MTLDEIKALRMEYRGKIPRRGVKALRGVHYHDTEDHCAECGESGLCECAGCRTAQHGQKSFPSQACEQYGQCSPLERRYLELRQRENTLYNQLDTAKGLQHFRKSLLDFGCLPDVAWGGQLADEVKELQEQIKRNVAAQHRLVFCNENPDHPACCR